MSSVMKRRALWKAACDATHEVARAMRAHESKEDIMDALAAEKDAWGAVRTATLVDAMLEDNYARRESGTPSGAHAGPGADGNSQAA